MKRVQFDRIGNFSITTCARVVRAGRSVPKRQREKRAERRAFASSIDRKCGQRFENWNERRALALPYFLRSTTRGSRVRKPPRLSAPRRSGSKFISALEMPWRPAPALPYRPPPETVQATSYWPL